MLEQPALFPELEQGLISTVKAKSFVHSGAFVSRDHELCRSICLDLLSGASRRSIAERYEVSRNTVNTIREIMDSRGELEPLKKEVAKRLDRCVIYGLENLENALEQDDLPASQLSVAVGILLDKKAALEGQPTARIEHVTYRKISHEELNTWLESLPSANPTAQLQAAEGPSESASEKEPRQPPAIEPPKTSKDG